MENIQFIRTLQFTDSFLPVGAFAYSDGLETAVAGKKVYDAETLRRWMEHFLDAVFVPCEGLALVKGMLALKAGDVEALCRIDRELTAIRPAAAVRASSSGVGKRLLSLYETMQGSMQPPCGRLTLPHSNAAAAYAIVFFHSGLDERFAALAFGYNRLSGMVSAALRLIAMGQQQGQSLLTQTLQLLPDSVDRILRMQDEPLRSFSPLLDIYQMNHQFVYSRLFRS